MPHDYLSVERQIEDRLNEPKETTPGRTMLLKVAQQSQFAQELPLEAHEFEQLQRELEHEYSTWAARGFKTRPHEAPPHRRALVERDGKTGFLLFGCFVHRRKLGQ